MKHALQCSHLLKYFSEHAENVTILSAIFTDVPRNVWGHESGINACSAVLKRNWWEWSSIPSLCAPFLWE